MAGQGELDWQAVRALFDRLIEADAAAREALLAAEPDAALAAEVRSLLAHESAGTTALLGKPAVPAASPERRGERLGAWRIVDRLGSGGMGEVWRAERADGAYAGAAAVKVMRRGMDSAAVLARFAQEQQALARLTHPNIAHLLDAGRTADALPYFVMELIDGQPIVEACAGRTLEERLALFLQLADAVAHAHRNLLVHRDLKPGNVLVTREGQVKLLDFGIAKALDPLEATPGIDHAAQHATVAGERPFTPQYASPEQVRGEPVSTATDIYSLGVLLYQMLTGLRPTGRAATTPAEAARSVLEEQPTRPSALSPDLVRDPQWAQHRKRLEGDLDNVLLKALEKDAAARYRSVEALAADIEAYLGGYPVSARPASLADRTWKFVTRNRVASAAVMLGVVGVLLGLAASLWQAQQAARSRDEARAQLAELKRVTTDIVFRYGDTVTTLPGGAKAQEGMLQATIASLEPALKAAPEDAELMATMASALGRLAELQGNPTVAAAERAGDARQTVDRALELADRIWAAMRGDWRFASWHVRTLIVHAQLQRREGRLEQAAEALRRAAARSEESLALERTDEGRMYLATGTANAHLTLAQVYEHGNFPSLGRPVEALASFERAERRLRAVLGEKAILDMLDRNAVPGDPSGEAYLTHQIGTIHGGRALIHMRQENLEAMRSEAERAMQMRRTNIAREPTNVVWRDGLMTEANILSIALVRLADWPAALQATTLAWDTAAGLARSEGPQSKWAASAPILAAQHGRALAGSGRHAEALEVLGLGLKHWRALAVKAGDGAASDNPRRRVAWHQVQIAASLAALGRRAEALALAEEARRALEPLAAGNSVRRDAQLALGEAHALLMRLDAAHAAEHRAAARAALEAAATERRLGADHAKLLAALG